MFLTWIPTKGTWEDRVWAKGGWIRLYNRTRFRRGRATRSSFEKIISRKKVTKKVYSIHFLFNFFFSSSFGRISFLITYFTSLNTIAWLYTTFLFYGFQILLPSKPSLYLIKMHLSYLLSNLVIFSFGTCAFASQLNTLRCERKGFLPVHTSCGFLFSNDDEGDLLTK